MNGARALLATLVDAGVDVCFSNPGTSEMHFVAALDGVPEMRGILALFEGVATGAADGYARVAGRPAPTQLHLGPGLGNGLANLHNARRARTPVVNIVGDHATYHARFDAPLESDIASIARSVSGWYRVTARADDVGVDAADAVAAAAGPPGCVATLVLPADSSWSESRTGPCPPRPASRPTDVPGELVDEVAKVLRSGEKVALLLGGSSLRARGLNAASRACATTGAAMLGETFPANLERGAGVPALDRLGYLAEFAQAQLAGVQHLVLVDAKAPVSFFAYPGKPSDLVPPGCTVHTLVRPGEDALGALEALADAVGAPPDSAVPAPSVRPDRPTGALNMETLAAAVGAALPEHVIVVDEGNTSGLFVAGATAGAPRHDWLTLTGGAIGIGLPAATGAAVAAPERPVLCLQADGSAMYTLQALWTQAREGLNVTTVILANRSYAILNLELQRVGADAGGPLARRLLELSDPDLDFTALSRGMGVPARRVESAEELTAAMEASFSEPGPSVIEVPLPQRMG
jgi:acetolactate synthase-1/2/3 large subunit